MARADVIRIDKELKDFTEQDIRDLAINLGGRFATDTPKDTGWAASSWEAVIGYIPTGVGEATGDPALAQARQDASIAALAKWTLEQGIIVWSNRTPYIGYLNEGHSQKAPAKFIEQGIAAEIKYIEETEA